METDEFPELAPLFEFLAELDPEELEIHDLKLWHHFIVKKKFKYLDLP